MQIKFAHDKDLHCLLLRKRTVESVFGDDVRLKGGSIYADDGHELIAKEEEV